MKEILIVYDNMTAPNDHARDIIGDVSYADVIFERKTFRSRMYDELVVFDFVVKIIPLDHVHDLDYVKRQIGRFGENYGVLHIYSYVGIRDKDEFSTVMNKLKYSSVNVYSEKNNIIFTYFCSIEEYISYILEKEVKFPSVDYNFEKMNLNCFFDFSLYSEFLKYISGSFQARYFNSLAGDEYVVTKQSKDKLKMKKEFTYYYLLPPEIQSWCVQPFDFKEGPDYASYSMERYGITDMAIKWVHQSVSFSDFDVFLQKVFLFIKSRTRKAITPERYGDMQYQLYITKMQDRIDAFKNLDKYKAIEKYVSHTIKYGSIDAIVNKYKNLYQKIQSNAKLEPVLVIGHGDLCFSNILYDKQTRLIRLIDPKGALTEAELWVDPYYDIAKLSHSICGLYDFFNSELYEIKVNSDINLEVIIDINKEREKYAMMFKSELEQSGFSYTLTRLYEASLFLSMLPLHIDNPKKVLGFILNAINIIDEIEKYADVSGY